MATLPVPSRSVALSPAGFRKIYEELRLNPASAKVIADEIESNPRRVLEHTFTMTERQKKAIETKSDEVLLARVRAMLAELRAESPGPLEFEREVSRPGGDDPPWYPDGGGCIVEIRPVRKHR